MIYTTISGLVTKKECEMKVNIGKISLRLVDRYNKSDKINIIAYLAPINAINGIPLSLLIGFGGALNTGKVFFNFLKKEASIEV